ncbi:MAG: hypothetical protein ACRDQ2_08315 [Gaiellales bacterium]
MAVSGESTDVFPESHQVLCPPVAEPPFEDPGELEWDYTTSSKLYRPVLRLA